MADRPTRRKNSDIVSQAATGLAAIRGRRAALEDPFGDVKPKKRSRPKPKRKVKEKTVTSTDVMRAAIGSQSASSQRRRSTVAQLKNLASQKRRKRKKFEFIEGRTKF